MVHQRARAGAGAAVRPRPAAPGVREWDVEGGGMDAKRLLGTLLGGVLEPPRRARRPARRRPVSLIDIRVGGSRRTAAALGALARLAAEVLAQTTAPAPSAPPAPAGRTPPPPPPAAGDAAKPPPPASPRPAPWGAAQPPPAPAAAPAVEAEDREALLMVRAMIAAARADGAIDAAERAAIAAQLDQAGLEPAARELVLAEFANPASVEALAAEITDPVLAAQVYAACVVAVGEASPAERAFLDALARRTGLAPATVAAIERRLAEGAAAG